MRICCFSPSFSWFLDVYRFTPLMVFSWDWWWKSHSLWGFYIHPQAGGFPWQISEGHQQVKTRLPRRRPSKPRSPRTAIDMDVVEVEGMIQFGGIKPCKSMVNFRGGGPPNHSSWFVFFHDLCYLLLKAQQILWFAAVSYWEAIFQVDMKEKDKRNFVFGNGYLRTACV